MPVVNVYRVAKRKFLAASSKEQREQSVPLFTQAVAAPPVIVPSHKTEFGAFFRSSQGGMCWLLES